MKLHDIGPTPGSKKARMRVGRGDGSNWGGTAGRGNKGQRSRTGAAIRHQFEGGQTPTFRKIPKRGFTNGVKEIFEVVNLGRIAEKIKSGELKTDAVIDQKALQLAALIGKGEAKLKVLGDGELKTAVKIKADYCSASAKAKIEAAGGSIELLQPARPPRVKKPFVKPAPKAEAEPAEAPKADKKAKKAEAKPADAPKADKKAAKKAEAKPAEAKKA